MYQNILTEIDAGVGIITLNRPERHNAFDDALIGELSAAIDLMAAEPAVRVLGLGLSASMNAPAEETKFGIFRM